MILEVPARDKKPWPSLGGLVCQWIEDNLVFGPGDLLGQKAKLDDEKRYLIWRAYEIYPRGHEQEGRRRFKRVAFSMRKGVAKTELMAWIAAAELAGPVRFAGWDARACPAHGKNKGKGACVCVPRGAQVRNPYIPMCAYTEEQTEELAYGALREILMRSKMADAFDIGLERIIRIGKNGQADGKAEAVASAPGARDGARTTFQGFDETHRFVLPALRKAHQTMLQNIPKRRLSDAWSLETTTAYQPGEHSVAEATHNYAKAVEAGRQKDSRLLFFHRQASDGYKLEEREQRRKAVVEASGPNAAWSSIDEITDQYDDPTIDRSYWERVWLNRPIRAADKAFEVARWKKLARPLVAGAPYRPARGALIAVGFDGARYRDSTAIVATELVTGFQWLPGVWEQDVLNPKWEVPVDEVNQTMDALFAEYDVWRLYADPPYWETVCNDWAGKYGDNSKGQPRVVFFLTNRHLKMADAVRAFSNAQADGSLSHDGDPRYERHIGNAHRKLLQMRDEQGQQLYVIQKARPDSPDKIDIGVAGVLSWQARNDARKDGIGLEPDVPQDYKVEWVA
jgi:phage terminase large subunit-like protein